MIRGLLILLALTQDEDVSFSDAIISESDAPPSLLNRKHQNPDEDPPPAGNKQSCSDPSLDVPPDDASYSDTENAPTQFPSKPFRLMLEA